MEVGTYEGKSVEAAIQKGLADQHVTLDDVHVKILQESRKGFLGLGERAAVVSLIPKNIVTEVAETVDMESEAVALDVPETITEPAHDEVVATGAVVESEVDAIETAKAEASETMTHAETEEEWHDVEDVAHYIIDVLHKYGVDDVTVDVIDEDDVIVYQIMTDKPGLVIGKHGKIINALEILVQVLTHRYVRNGVHVSLDVDDYRERRYAILERLAKRVAHDVMTDHDTVYLDPLPAGERKIVHNLLAQYPNIKTHSEGREPYRYLVASYKD